MSVVCFCPYRIPLISDLHTPFGPVTDAQNTRILCLVGFGQDIGRAVLIRCPTRVVPPSFVRPLSFAPGENFVSPGDDDPVASIEKRQRGGRGFPESDFVHPRRNRRPEAVVQSLRSKGQGELELSFFCQCLFPRYVGLPYSLFFPPPVCVFPLFCSFCLFSIVYYLSGHQLIMIVLCVFCLW